MPESQPGPAPQTTPRIAVIGGGISGLAAAHHLLTAPLGDQPAAHRLPRVTVLEQSDRWGGKLRLGELGGLPVDVGAEAVLARRPEPRELIEAAGLEPDLVHPATTRAAIAAGGRLHPLPAGTATGVPADPAAARGLLTDAEVADLARAGRQPLPAPAGDTDVAAFITERLGRPVLDRLVEPLLSGVYAGQVHRLSAEATLPALWAAAKAGAPLLDAAGPGPSAAAPGPVFAGLRGGVGRLPGALAGTLRSLGADLRLGVTVREMQRTPTGWRLLTGPATRGPGVAPQALEVDAVILAVPAPSVARLLRGAVPAAAAPAAQIEVASMAVVSALIPREQLAGVSGSGILLARPGPGQGGRGAVKAVTFSSAKWAWTDQLDPRRRVVRMSIGRAGETAELQRDDADLAALALAELGRLLGGRPISADAVAVQRWGGGLPQYAVGHLDRIERLRAAVAAAGRLAVCGAMLDGVGVAACIASARRAAESVYATMTP